MAQIEAKKAEQYSDEDFKKLESLMYDRFTVRLESAQVRLVCACMVCKSS
jgi:vacuolar protein sorting-associated protein 13A/C